MINLANCIYLLFFVLHKLSKGYSMKTITKLLLSWLKDNSILSNYYITNGILKNRLLEYVLLKRLSETHFINRHASARNFLTFWTDELQRIGWGIRINENETIAKKS